MKSIGQTFGFEGWWSFCFIAFTKEWFSLGLCGGLAAADTCDNSSCLHKYNCSNINSEVYVEVATFFMEICGYINGNFMKIPRETTSYTIGIVVDDKRTLYLQG